MKLTIRNDSSLSNMNIWLSLKFLKLIMHRDFFGILPQNAEYVKTVCNGLQDASHLACPKWIINQKFEKKCDIGEN